MYTGNLQPPRQHAQPGHMVGMLVGDEDGVDATRVLAAEHQAPQQFATGKTGIDQQAGGGA